MARTPSRASSGASTPKRKGNARTSASKRSNASTARKGCLRPLIGLCLLLSVVGGLAMAGALFYFSAQIDERMAGRTWDIPSRLYPAPLILQPGTPLPPGPLEKTLEAMGYIKAKPVQNPGEYRDAGNGRFYLRPRPPWAGLKDVPDKVLEVQVGGGQVTGLKLFKGGILSRAVVPAVAFAEIRKPEQESRRLVKLQDVPKSLQDAVVAIEDRRFYQHWGVDPRGLARAIYVNLARRDRAQGGSTLTQQLARNYFLTLDKTFTRKIKELFYALALERRYPKPVILELYLNEVYLGQRGAVAISGVGQAAWTLFSKDVRQLKLEEAALLAGIIQSPNAYAPERHPERARARRDVVLKAMLDQGFIGEKDYAAAAKTPVKLRLAPYVARTAPWFVDYVGEQIGPQFPDTSFDAEGFSLETSLEMRVQQATEAALRDGLNSLQKQSKGALQGAVVAISPRTGRILAMVGGRDYGLSQYNRATQARRQPGSAFKPLVLLNALLHKGAELGPATVLVDEPLTIQFDGKSYTPRNSDGEFHGEVTLRQVLEQSLNVPTVRLAQEIGFDKLVAFYQRLHLSGPLKPVPSLPLGVLEVSPLEVAAAFTVLATNGTFRTPWAVSRVLDRDGRVLWEQPAPKEETLAPLEPVYLVRDMMRGVLDRGTGKGARAQGYSFPASGKTGTTNEFRDAWFVGFDAELLMVVWVGADDNSSIGLTGSQAALPVWTRAMRAVRGSDPPPSDPLPTGLVTAEVCADSLQLPTDGCPARVKELYWPGHEPADVCQRHVALSVPVLEEQASDGKPGLERLPGLLRRLFDRTRD